MAKVPATRKVGPDAEFRVDGYARHPGFATELPGFPASAYGCTDSSGSGAGAGGAQGWSADADRGRDHPLCRFDVLRLRPHRLVRALDRRPDREVPLRPADDDRLAGGDLPVHVRDDQPEQGRRASAGACGPPVADDPDGRGPEREADHALAADPRSDTEDPRSDDRTPGQAPELLTGPSHEQPC